MFINILVDSAGPVSHVSWSFNLPAYACKRVCKLTFVYFDLTQGQDFYTGVHFTFIAFTCIHWKDAESDTILEQCSWELMIFFKKPTVAHPCILTGKTQPLNRTLKKYFNDLHIRTGLGCRCGDVQDLIELGWRRYSQFSDDRGAWRNSPLTKCSSALGCPALSLAHVYSVLSLIKDLIFLLITSTPLVIS